MLNYTAHLQCDSKPCVREWPLDGPLHANGLSANAAMRAVEKQARALDWRRSKTGKWTCWQCGRTALARAQREEG